MNFKPNGILSATSARQKAEKNRARVIAHNPNENMEALQDSEEETSSPHTALIARSERKKALKFLGFWDGTRPDSDIFRLVPGVHAKCGGDIYKSTHVGLGTYTECAKCGAWGVNATVTSKRVPRSFFM